MVRKNGARHCWLRGGAACVEEARRRTDASSIGALPGSQASHFPEPLTIVAADKHDPMSVWCVWQRQGLCVRKGRWSDPCPFHSSRS